MWNLHISALISSRTFRASSSFPAASSGRSGWLVAGSKFYKNRRVCPFCNGRMTGIARELAVF